MQVLPGCLWQLVSLWKEEESFRSPRSHAAPAVIAALGPPRNCEKNAPMSSTKCVSPPLGPEGLKWVRGSNRIGSGLLLGATEEG